MTVFVDQTLALPVFANNITALKYYSGSYPYGLMFVHITSSMYIFFKKRPQFPLKIKYIYMLNPMSFKQGCRPFFAQGHLALASNCNAAYTDAIESHLGSN